MFIRCLTLAAALSAPASALIHRSYSSSSHDRFLNFGTTPVANPNFIWSHLDLTGIGWDQAPDLQYALVSRRHVLFATHFVQPLSRTMYFLNASGTVIPAVIQSSTVVQDGGQPSDLTLLTLATPIEAGSGITPLPYLDLPLATDYIGKTIGVIGHSGAGISPVRPVGGSMVIKNVELVPRTVPTTTLNPTRYMEFDYLAAGPGLSNSNVYFEIGDSGSPTFVETGGRAALVGTHSYVIDGSGLVFAENYDTFLPHYVPALNALMAPLGYRMRPVNAPATTLSGTSSTVETTPRRLKPLTLGFELQNTGANLTGNLEVEFLFPTGQEPDSVSASGWVSSGSGTKRLLRKATLASGVTATLSAVWTEAPALGSVTPTLVWRSDTVTDQSASPVISLAPSFAEWAAGLAAPGELDDPDEDDLINLFEYVFGGDAEDGRIRNANGGPLMPYLSHDGASVSLHFPERVDKELRAISYVPRYGDSLGGWSSTPPPGAVSATAAYAPDIPGFVERTITWPAGGTRTFAQVEVTLSE